MKLHTIVVSSWGNGIEEAHVKARELFGWVSPVCPLQINGYRSFFIPPDGSKEGWEASDKGDESRAAFILWMRDNEELYLDWVEAQYGDDEGDSKICRHSDDEWTPLEEA